MKFLILIPLLFLAHFGENPDYSAVLKSLEIRYQKCLDKGTFMSECSRKYSNQMDSMLNVVYRQLMNKYDAEEQNKLKLEERDWIKERDIEFKKIQAKADKLRDEDNKMFVYDKQAAFIKKRVEQLILELENPFYVKNRLIMGTWIAEEDMNWTLVFTSDKKCRQYLAGKLSQTDAFSISNVSPQCGVEVKVNEATCYLQLSNAQEGSLCYIIGGLTEESLSLIKVGEGDTIVFKRL